MEIIDKKTYKIEIKNKVDKYMKEFPFYFLFNILLNLITIASIVIVAVFVALGLRFATEGSAYGLVLIAGLLAFLKIISKGFFKNINTLKSIREGNYDFEIEDYEMDNAIEFIEDLPIKKEDLERMRKSLSYDKIIDVLETVNIIICKNGLYDVDLIFKYRTEQAIESENNMKNYSKKELL